MIQFRQETRANQENTDAKIVALVDAQIRSEDEMKEFRRETNEFRRATKQMFNHLVKVIDKMDKRIELLEKKNNNSKKNGKGK
jgi:molecular chaperone GrpE (heat shock protein)